MSQTICLQCYGKGACIGIEAPIDLNSNTQTAKMSGAQPGMIPCQQCGGKGYYQGQGS